MKIILKNNIGRVINLANMYYIKTTGGNKPAGSEVYAKSTSQL